MRHGLQRLLQELCRAASHGPHAVAPGAPSAGLLQLQQRWPGSLVASSSSGCCRTFTSLAAWPHGAPTAAAAAAAAAQSGLLRQQCVHAALQPCASSSSSSWCGDGAGSARGYARAPPRLGRNRRPPAHHQQQQQGQQGQQGQGQQGRGRSSSRSSSWQPPQELGQLRLGRAPALCAPTDALRAPAFLDDYDPWQERSRDAMMPRQLDGSRGDDVEDLMMMRQQLENSALPNEFKRSRFISPAWDDVLLQVKRTVKVTKGGKVETLHALVAVGNGDGLIGIGEHSGKNIQKVMLDAQLKAYRNLVAVPRYRKHTVYHPIDLKRRKIRMQMWPRFAGFGITASPLMTTLCELAGIKDATIKLSGRRKNVRNAVATFVEAVAHRQTLPHDGVEGSGVYAREVYAGPLDWGLRRGVDI